MRSGPSISPPVLIDIASDQPAISTSDSSFIFPDTLPGLQTQAQDNTFRREEPPHLNSQRQTVQPTQSRIDNYVTNPFNSVLTMPIPGTKLAPEKFRGDFHKVREFIQHFERLCAQNNVVKDAEKCETVLRYCSRRERQTIKNILSYSTKKWEKLKYDILKLYDADLDTKKYKVRDVRNFSKKQKQKKVRNLAEWKKYCRAFLRVAGSLLAEKKIGSKEYATYFWQGIPRTLRMRLENRLLAGDPVRDLSEPFEVDDIDRAAEAILQRDRFDRALDDSDSDEEDSSGVESSSESDDESSSDESEEERNRRKRRVKKKTRSKKSTTSALEAGKDDSARKRSAVSSRKEVEGLIRQMNLLTQDDPQYGLAYYRALKLDPDVSKIVGGPAFRTMSGQGHMRGNVNTYQSLGPPQPIQNAGSANPSQPAFMDDRNARPPPPRSNEMQCFGCGQKGHGMSRCPAVSDLIARGVLTRDHGGRIMHKDGSAIRRFGNETYVQAIERENRPLSSLITIVDDTSGSESDEEWSEKDDDEYGEMEEVFVVRDLTNQSYEVERPEKQITARKRQVLDGVYPPRLKEGGKENRPANPETGRAIRPGKSTTAPPARAMDKGKERARPRKAQEQSPVDVHAPRYDAGRDDQIIEDSPQIGQKRPRVEAPDVPNQVAKVPDKRLPRKSAISNHVDPFKLLNHVLNAKVELAVGEVFGVSRELSQMLADSIKPKAAKAQVPVGLATSGSGFRAKTRGLLIKVTMECDGNPIQAIIDTGSQLNIVSERTCKSLIRRPIDYSAPISMNDANGGEGKLTGVVENVPLDFGSVKTRANLYVGPHVPFDLLLGRPWQRGNLVSIDELEDGTYLVFKDPGTMAPKHKVLVTPDAISTGDWDFDPSTWFASKAPMSFFVGEVPDAHSENDASPSSGPRMEGRPFSLNQLDPKRIEDPDEKELRKRRIELTHLIRHATRDRLETIKEGEELNKNPLPPHPHFLSNMQLKIAPARVNHEAELPSLFTSPTTLRTEPETLLAGIGDIPHFSRNQHLRDLVLASHEGLVIGHQIDPFGYHRTDLMLMKMGLVTPKFPSGNNSGTHDLDIQFGTAIVHFYPNLGGPAPPNWEIPYVIPPVIQASVSDESSYLTRSDLNQINADQVSAQSAIRYLPYRRPALSDTSSSFDPLALVEVSSLEEEDDEDNTDSRDLDHLNPSSSEDEVHLACHRCLGSHDCSCPFASPSPLAITRISAHGEVDADIRLPTPDSLPPLESISDSGDEEEENSRKEWGKNWERFREDVREELQDEVERARERRLDQWGEYEEAAQKAQEDERILEMLENLQDPIFRNADSTAVDACTDDPSPPYSTGDPTAPEALLLSRSVQISSPPPPFTNLFNDPTMNKERQETIDRLIEMQDRIDAAIKAKIEEAPPPKQLTPTDIINLARAYRLAAGEINYGLSEMIPFSSNTTSAASSSSVPVIPPPRPKLDIGDKENTPPRLSFSAANPPQHIFNREPIQVYSVHVPISPVPIPIRDFKRTPTPYPDLKEEVSSFLSQEARNFDNKAEGLQRLVSPSPNFIFQLTPPPSEPNNSLGESTARAFLGVDVKSEPPFPHKVKREEGTELPSPTDTEIVDPIEQLMLPPARRRLPPPPISVRPDYYRDVRDEFLDSREDSSPEVEEIPWSAFDHPPTCFEPHILALTRDRVLYPFVEINRPGPVTDTTMPVQERTYYPYPDLDVHYNIARVERHIVVDLRDRKIATSRDEIPDGLRAVWSVLAPRNAPLGLVYPGLLWSTSFGPTDLLHVTASTIGDRFEQILEVRRLTVAFIERVRRTLSQWQIKDLENPSITLYTMSGNYLFEKKVNRAMFFRIIHPTFNPLITREEATFLRGACYALRDFQHDIMAEAIDRILRQPQMDEYMCRELLARGCLDGGGDRESAYKFLEEYEALAEGDDYESDIESSDED